MGKWFFRRLDRWELEGNAYFLFYQRGNDLGIVTLPSNERPWTLLRWLCCISMIRRCSHEGRTRVFLNAHYVIVLPEPFQNGTVFNSLAMPAVRGKIRVHREMVFPKEGGYFRLTTA